VASARSADRLGEKVREFIDWLPKRLDDYRKSILTNAILVARSRGVAVHDG
jgi:NADH-quinone oxidoreductase subunit C/D